MSPRPGPRRPYVALRLDDDALAWIDAEAERRGLNRSQMMRAMLAFARQKMPREWRPGRNGVRA